MPFLREGMSSQGQVLLFIYCCTAGEGVKPWKNQTGFKRGAALLSQIFMLLIATGRRMWLKKSALDYIPGIYRPFWCRCPTRFVLH